jgi:hypothetical protein
MEAIDDLQPISPPQIPLMAPIDDSESMEDNLKLIIQELKVKLEKMAEDCENNMCLLHGNAAKSIILKKNNQKQTFRVSLILTSGYDLFESCFCEIKQVIKAVLQNRIPMDFDFFLSRILLGAMVTQKFFQTNPELVDEIRFFAFCVQNSVNIIMNKSEAQKMMNLISQKEYHTMWIFSNIPALNQLVCEFLA